MFVLAVAVAVIAALSLVLVLVAATMLRVFRNVGPLDLEDYARRNHVVFIPVSQELVAELEEWSKPVKFRLDSHRHPLLAELIVQPAGTPS